MNGRPALVALVSAVCLTLVTSPVTASPTARADEEPECATVAPPLSMTGVTDEGVERELRALVLLDGVPKERARQVVAEAAEAYQPLRITLTARYRKVELSLSPGDRDPTLFIDAAQAAVGGRRPKGVDVVHLLTARDMAGQGYANCIGGVAFPAGAFSVSEELSKRTPMITGNPPIPMPWPWGDQTSLVIAHELGHLMGAQHHLSNCVEGLSSVGDLPRPCTLMDGSLTMAMRFSNANAMVVRGYAEGFLTEAD